MTDDDDFTLKANDSLAIVNCFNISLGPPKSPKGSQVGGGHASQEIPINGTSRDAPRNHPKA